MELLSVLSDDLEAVEAHGPALDDDRLRQVYEAMVLVRHVDDVCRQLHADGKIGFWVPCRGQEAVAVGASSALETDDWLFPSYRDAGMFLVRGGSLRALFDQLFGSAEDLVRGRQIPGSPSLPNGRFVSVSSPLGSQIVQATGCAIAMASRGDRRMTLVSFGAAATAAAEFYDGLRFGARFRAPVVFLCQNIGAGPEAHRFGAGSVSAIAEAHGVAAVCVDGSDVLAVYKAVVEARGRALEGSGPTLIEALIGQRIGTEQADGQDVAPVRGNPIERLRHYLGHRGAWDGAWEEEINGRSRRRVEDVVTEAAAAAPPTVDTLFADVYAELPPALESQREAAKQGDRDA